MIKMKEIYDVILINPKFSISVITFKQNIPANLIALGSYLIKKGLKVKMIDCLTEDDHKRVIKDYSKKSKIFGFGVMTSQTNDALNLCKIIKENNPKAKIVWGGIHSTLFPKQTVQHKLIDFIISKEGEAPLYQLIKAIKKNKLNKKNLRKIKGLTFKMGREIISNEEQPPLIVKELPPTDWSLVSKKVIKLYQEDYDIYHPILISTSRGCPHRCTFCVNVCIGNKWRARTPKQVIDEIKYIVNEFGIKKIKFRDECFFVDKNRVKKVLQGLIDNKLNISWETNCRVDYFTKGVVDDEILDLMKKTNCHELSFGVESGDENILKKIKKDITLNDALYAAKKLSKYGISGAYSFMIATPYETKKEMIKTLKFMKKLKNINRKLIKVYGVQPYRPYPGGEMYEEAVKLGWKSPETLEEWDKLNDELNLSTSSKHYPWVKHNLFVDSMNLYSQLALANWNNIIKAKTHKVPLIFVVLFTIIAKLRFFLNFYDYLIEMKAVNLYSKIKF